MATITLGSKTDPIANFGRDGARAVLREIRKVPRASRQEALKLTLDQIHPSLFPRLAPKAKQLESMGAPAPVALEKALAATLANRFAEEMVAAGRPGGRRPFEQLMALGCAGGCDNCAMGCAEPLDGYESVDGVGSWLKSGVKATVNAPIKGAKATYRGVKKGAKATWKYTKKGANYAAMGAKYAGKALAKVTCVAANTGVLSAAAGAAGSVYGGPAGGAAGTAGAAMVQGVCAPGQVAVPVQEGGGYAIFPGFPRVSGTTILLLGGGGLLLLLLATQPRRGGAQ